MFFNVVVDELRGHASHLDGLLDRLNTAGSAAVTVSMADDAYGLLCSFLPPIINPMEQAGIDALTAASDAVGATAENIRTTATHYQDTDETNSLQLKDTLGPQTARSTMENADVKR